MIRLALLSLHARRGAAALAMLAIACSVALFLGVEKVRVGARASFAGAIAGTDLIAGARGGAVPLLLYSVFRIGNATANMSAESYADIAAHPDVAWTVPLSLGDSHRGFRVLGTTRDYFTRYRFRGGQSLAFADGAAFADLFDAVIGAEAASALGYAVGDSIAVAHGLGAVSFAEHDDMPFRVSGVLARTGTPVDRTVHVGVEAIEAIHLDWASGARRPGASTGADEARALFEAGALAPKAVTAAMVGVTSKIATFRVKRWIDEYRGEALMAILPGVALQELWDLVGVAETALTAVSAMVVVTALLGMATMILSSLGARRREMAILRAVGARPRAIAGLLVAEAALLSAAGVAAGLAALYAALAAARAWIDARWGLYLEIAAPDAREWVMLAIIVAAGAAVGAIPAFRAYRLSLADGMTVRF